jgi:hypothetical protein
VKLDLTGSPLPSWGLMLPDLQAAIVRVKQATGVDLDSARALLAAPPSDTAVVSGAGGWGARLMKDEPKGGRVAGGTANGDDDKNLEREGRMHRRATGGEGREGGKGWRNAARGLGGGACLRQKQGV